VVYPNLHDQSHLFVPLPLEIPRLGITVSPQLLDPDSFFYRSIPRVFGAIHFHPTTLIVFILAIHLERTSYM
jgi:hypothetical protein